MAKYFAFCVFLFLVINTGKLSANGIPVPFDHKASVNKLPPPPDNANPCNEIPLSVNGTGTCSFTTTYTNVDATLNPIPGTPSCGNLLAADAWFSVTVPSDGGLTINTQAGTITD